MNNFETNISSVEEIQLSSIEEKSPEERRVFMSKIGSVAFNSIKYASFAFMAHTSANNMFPAASPAATIGGSLLATATFFVGGNKITSMAKERKARKSEKTTSETQPISTEIDDNDTSVV